MKVKRIRIPEDLQDGLQKSVDSLYLELNIDNFYNVTEGTHYRLHYLKMKKEAGEGSVLTDTPLLLDLGYKERFLDKETNNMGLRAYSEVAFVFDGDISVATLLRSAKKNTYSVRMYGLNQYNDKFHKKRGFFDSSIVPLLDSNGGMIKRIDIAFDIPIALGDFKKKLQSYEDFSMEEIREYESTWYFKNGLFYDKTEKNSLDFDVTRYEVSHKNVEWIIKNTFDLLSVIQSKIEADEVLRSEPFSELEFISEY